MKYEKLIFSGLDLEKVQDKEYLSLYIEIQDKIERITNYNYIMYSINDFMMALEDYFCCLENKKIGDYLDNLEFNYSKSGNGIECIITSKDNQKDKHFEELSSIFSDYFKYPNIDFDTEEIDFWVRYIQSIKIKDLNISQFETKLLKAAKNFYSINKEEEKIKNQNFIFNNLKNDMKQEILSYIFIDKMRKHFEKNELDFEKINLYLDGFQVNDTETYYNSLDNEEVDELNNFSFEIKEKNDRNEEPNFEEKKKKYKDCLFHYLSVNLEESSSFFLNLLLVKKQIKFDFNLEEQLLKDLSQEYVEKKNIIQEKHKIINNVMSKKKEKRISL